MKPTILLIDDSCADAELVRRSLSTGPNSPSLIFAEDGALALRMLRQTASQVDLPDLILLDVNMPRLGGFEILNELKSDPALKSIPVVMMSSSETDRDVDKAYGLHANSYLTKPMDIDGYIKALRSIEEFWFSLTILPGHRH